MIKMIDFPIIEETKKAKSRRQLLHGVGFNNVYYRTTMKRKNVRVTCPYYQVWHTMIKHCYSEKFQEKHPEYRNIVVCNDWLTFSKFRAWMVTQDWENKILVNDAVRPNSQIYSAKQCRFI